MRKHLISAASLALVLTTVVCADPPDDGDVLRGPAVSGEAVRTLVQRDMSGRLAILEERPEIAGTRLLDLDGAERVEVDAVIEAHAERMRKLLIDHLDLLKESGDALRAGDEERAARAGTELYERFDSEHRRDPVMDALLGVLTDEQGAELGRLVDEYWDALVGAETRGMKEVTREQRETVEGRLKRAMFQREVGTTYEYAIRPYQQRIDYICDAIEATPEERSMVRDVVVEFMQETRLTPTPEQRMDAIREIYLGLDEEGRLKLFELLAKQTIQLQANG